MIKAGFTPTCLDCGDAVPRNLPGREMAVSVESSPQQPASAHVIVLGSHKDGTGKSTIAMHVAVALMNCGQRVATIDLDARQKSFTHYVENRRAWAKSAGLGLALPTHFCIARGATVRLDENEAIE